MARERGRDLGGNAVARRASTRCGHWHRAAMADGADGLGFQVSTRIPASDAMIATGHWSRIHRGSNSRLRAKVSHQRWSHGLAPQVSTRSMIMYRWNNMDFKTSADFAIVFYKVCWSIYLFLMTSIQMVRLFLCVTKKANKRLIIKETELKMKLNWSSYILFNVCRLLVCQPRLAQL